MTLNWLRGLAAILVSTLALSFTSCSALGGSAGQLGGPLVEALGQVTGFSTDIGDWSSKLGGALGGDAFEQLKGYAGKAGELKETLGGLTDGLGDAMKNPLEAIGSKLGDMAGFDVEGLKALVPAEQLDAVKGFAGSAGDVGALTGDFLKTFGG